MAATIALVIGSIYPIERELDLAAFTYSSFQSAGPIALEPGQEDELFGALPGSDSVLGLPQYTAIRASGTTFSPMIVLAMSGMTSQTVTLMPPATLVSSVPVAGDNWIDLSADAAHALGLKPGQPVQLMAGPNEWITLTLRAIYAVRVFGAAGYGQMSPVPLQDYCDAADLAGTQLLTTMPASSVDAILNSGKWAEALTAGGYNMPVPVESRDAMRARAAEQSSSSLALVLTLAIAASVAVLLISAREGVVFLQKADGTAKLLDDLGMPRRTALRFAFTLLGVAMLVVLGVAAISAHALMARGVIVPVFPPTLELRWWLTVAGVCVLALGVTLAYTAMTMRKRHA